MKKTVIVTITKSLEVDIPDEMLSEKHLKDFSSWMFDVSTPDELFGHAARCIVRNKDNFVGGIGNVSYTERYKDVETEVL